MERQRVGTMGWNSASEGSTAIISRNTAAARLAGTIRPEDIFHGGGDVEITRDFFMFEGWSDL